MALFLPRRIIKTCTHQYLATPEEVFPLLCPEREKDWLHEWRYEMVYSQSGLVEEGCIFTTPHHSDALTTWVVTEHDPAQFKVCFVRFTPDEMLVRLWISLNAASTSVTTAQITYEYTPLTEQQQGYLDLHLDEDFEKSMVWWENALNHFLKTGQVLLPS